MSIKMLNRRVYTLTLLTAAVSLGLSGCSDNDSFSSNIDDNTYAADIQRTEFGIPHITAKDYKGLGYGVGYAFAEDNICSLARELVVASGESMLYLGTEGNMASDVFYTWYNSPARRAEFLAAQDPEVIDAVTGYAAGYSRYLRDKGVAKIDPACANAKWVREITIDDLLIVYGKANLRGGLSNFVGPIVAAAPPAANGVMGSSRMRSVEASDPVVDSAPAFDMSTINAMDGGSNAYAFGSEVTGTSSGVMYGNPHEPWEGVQRFYEFHLTLPGELDVMGAAQQGQPFINIGFNKDVAWSHTVSTAKRFTLYQLNLVNGDPMKYNYKNSAGVFEQRDIESVPITIKLPNDQTLVRPIYLSQYGPMLAVDKVSGALPAWGTYNLAFTIRDAASENPRALNQWRSMNKATSVEDLVDRMQDIVGLGFVNTIATDRYGKALYADISTVPHVTKQKLEACSAGLVLGGLIAADLPALNGSTADCEWGSDADSPQAGIFGRTNLPFLIRNDYVANSNDSYWLSNPTQPLTDFSPLLRRRLLPFLGPNPVDGVPLLMRSRMGLTQIADRLSNKDNLGGNTFNLENMQEVVYGNRSYVAKLVLDDVLADCKNKPMMPISTGGTVDATTACTVLSNWDRRNNLDSQGAHVFREFWSNVDFTETTDDAFSVKFNVNDPVNTPSGLIINESTRTALGDSIKFFQDKNIALDASLSDLQYVIDAGKSSEKISMHGGLGREGVFNVAQSQSRKIFRDSVETITTVNADGTYGPIINGPTYMQTVTFDDKGPVVEALLAYSQSADKTRPYHRDQTRRYSAKEWIRLPFSAGEISKQAVGNKIQLRE
ncbi:penicillin acylase family protein [Psychrobacter sp. DAB_AL43B]|uniref:penicillin acylase family protein n=1 Tax=Psychrobacter sp. DAB_AL43B TaxID=1028416 RepID=UPI0009A5FE27|nr:penicillin acylase family protein [Psychrobacter sp. DAB_AL43B]SLJ85962.1 acyl-homoserine-lactone acylase [Psychrobacter sp. DAB_AL43B]